MIPTISYAEIIQKLSSDFDYWQRDEQNLKVTMCGLLFARPQSELASKEIFPELDYFDNRLGPHFHLFTAGCFRRSMPVEGYPDKRPIGPRDRWLYSDTAFDCLRREIESSTRWRYRDGVELLLFNATRNARTGGASLDFHSAIAVDLQRLREQRTSEAIASLIGKLANYCEQYSGDDPTWGFSDQIGTRIAGSALWSLILSFLPEGLRRDASTARLFVTEDLSRAHR
jgi:hypothetical protein